MNSYRVALIPGDGIGVDVVNEGCKVLDAMGLKFDTQNYDLGANRYLKSGETLPDSVLTELKKFDLYLSKYVIFLFVKLKKVKNMTRLS